MDYYVKQHATTYKNIVIRTPGQLKYWHCLMHPDSHFFDYKTMKFFRDTMKNYGIRNHADCIELVRKRPVNGGLTASAYFDRITLKQIKL